MLRERLRNEVSDHLPDVSAVKLVVKLKKRRVYVYRGENLRSSYPVAIGKPGWETLQGTFQVFSKGVNHTFKSFNTGRIKGLFLLDRITPSDLAGLVFGQMV